MTRLPTVLLHCTLFTLTIGSGLGAAQEPPTFEEVLQRFAQTTDLEESVRLAQQLLEMAETSGDPRERLEAYGNLSLVHYNRGEYDRANHYVELGFALLDEMDGSPEDRRFFAERKALTLWQLGQVEPALEYAIQAHDLAQESDSRDGLLQTTQTLANLYGESGDHSQSLRYHLESLESLDLENTPDRLAVLNNVVLSLIRMGDLDRALEYSDQLEGLRHSIQEMTPEVGRASPTFLLNRANILRLQGRYQEQLSALQEAHGLLQDYPDERTRNLILSAFADAYINLGDYNRAVHYARRALEGVDPDATPYVYAIAIANLGIALSKSGSHSQGLRYLEEATQILERIQARSEALELQGLVAEAYEESGNNAAALAAYKRFKQSTDELHREQIQSQLAAARTEFDVTLTRKEMGLLEAERQLQELVIGRQRLVALSAIAGLIALSIILGLGWNRYRIRTRAFAALTAAHEKLNSALEEVRTLQGLLPICANCKKIRDDQGLWNQIESYISRHSEAQFTHCLCPDCVKELYPDYVTRDVCPARGSSSRRMTEAEELGRLLGSVSFWVQEG